MKDATAIALILGIVTHLPAWAQDECKAQLAEVDARLASADLGPSNAGLQQMRDQAAALCEQGQDAMALQLLSLFNLSLPPTQTEQSSVKQADEDSKAMLTDKFLAGTWCSMTGEERSQLVFNLDGTYRYCLHDSMLGPYGKCSRNAESTRDWLARYPHAQTVEQDTLVLGGKRGFGDSTFKRGECTLYGR
jgi:hypothetical protein